jgi:CheY-like chemotaxis protein
MNERAIVLLGELATPEGPAAAVVRAAGMTPIYAPQWADDLPALRQPGIAGVLFAAGLKGFERVCVELRSDVTSEDLPLIAVVDEPWDPRLDRLFLFSLDDYVVAGQWDTLEAKLVALSRGNPWGKLPPTPGKVAVADPDRTRRVLKGRMLKRKGFEVEFAADAKELLRVAGDAAVRVVLIAAELPPGGAAAVLAESRKAGGRLASLPWIVDGTRPQLEAFDASTKPVTPVRLLDREDPLESVITLVDELLSPLPENLRQSRRLLYGGAATFRIVGSGVATPTYTFNINRTGLFLRTLVPPPRGAELIVDVRPPHGEGRARVYARVVWRRECSQQGGPVVPAGMGVIYTNVPLADGAALEAGYAALLETAPRASLHPLEAPVTEVRPTDAAGNEEVAGESD